MPRITVSAVTVPVGVATAPVHGEDADTLLTRADIALYAAKALGKRTFRVFAPEMEFRVQARMRLEDKLRDALQDELGLFVFYQPIVDIRDGRITAREALIRWHHPGRGWIPPGEFVPVAEDSGLIEQLGVRIVAEGVETEAHLNRIAAEGCYEVQGYYFGRPAPRPQDIPIIARVEAERAATAQRDQD